MDEWILDVIRAAGYLGIILLMVLENLVPAIPSELILPFAGYLAARGELHLGGVIGSASVGSVVGAFAWYVVGRRWGKAGVHRFVEQHGRWILLDVEDVERAEAWFARHTRAASFFGRLVPGVRSLISIPAGVTQTPLPAFLTATAAGTVIFTSLLSISGYVLADAYERTRDVVGPVGSIVFGIVVITLVVRRLRHRRARA